MNKQVRFNSNMTVLKAWTDEETGHRKFSCCASTDCLDVADERFVQASIDAMKQCADGGTVDLVETHNNALPMAKTSGHIDGSLVWELAKAHGVQASGPEALFVPVFDFDYGKEAGLPAHGNADLMYAMALAGDMPFQFSVGGAALGKKVYDKEAKRIICELWPPNDGTPMINHVMVTRVGKACNPDTFPIGIVSKAEDWEQIEAPEGSESESVMNDKEKESASEGAELTPEELQKATDGEIIRKLSESIRAELGEEEWAWVEELVNLSNEGDCIYRSGGKNYQCHYVINADGTVTRSNIIPVKQVWVADVPETGEVVGKSEQSAEETPAAEIKPEEEVVEAESGAVSEEDTVNAEEADKSVEEAPVVTTTEESETSDVAKKLSEKEAENATLAAKLEKANAEIERLKALPDPDANMPHSGADTSVDNPYNALSPLQKARVDLAIAKEAGDHKAILKAKEDMKRAHAQEVAAAKIEK